MKLAIRIAGFVKINRDVEETLQRMRLRRKYAAVLLPATPLTEKLLRSVRNFIAYGDISQETLFELVKKRAQPLDKKKTVDVAALVEQLAAGKKKPQELGIKPFFRLHPPRRGIDSKLHFGVRKGVLGDNKENINEFVRRML